MNSGLVLIVEDNLTTARTLRLFLESEGFAVTHAATGSQALLLLQGQRFDLIVLDLMLPDVDGISVCRKLRQQHATPLVMLTARTTEDEIVEGLEAGADDYVCKPFGSKELLARIRRCLRSQTQTADPLCVGVFTIDGEKRIIEHHGQPLKLTRSEFDILALLLRNPGRVFTRDQIINQALPPDFDGFERTVDTHIWSIRKKLKEPRGAPRYLQSELGVGYRLVHPREPA